MLERTSSLSSVLIMGDLNIHLDVLDRADTVKFNSLMTTHGFTQHVQSTGFRGYGYPWINPWIYPCVDMRLRLCCGYIHGYYAGTPAN